MKRLDLRLWSVAILFAAPGLGLSADDAVKQDDASTTEPTLFERVRVTGSPDEMRNIPGSVTYLGMDQLGQQQYADVHRILSMAPGVQIQEEEGYGLRPNIGMRGSGSERSSKITTMEDGVLIAPAPYAAPSAYYFPTAGRMEGVEVRKGSSSIQHGPFTTGGVLNFVSSSIPSSFGGSLNVAMGDDRTLRGKFNVGDSGERFGWLVETYRHDTEGFKTLDGGGETGFDLEDYMVKFRVTSRPGAAAFQALELKLGKTRQFGNETYVGLTDEDFAVDPLRRYAGSAQDNIDSDHEQIQARYLVRPSDRLDVTATVYRNDFFRNWHKLQSVGGLGLSSIFENPNAPAAAAALAILRGELAADSADDALAVRNNRRDYYSQGLHVVAGFKPGGTGSRHDFELGLRLHQDEEDRFQNEEDYRMTAEGRMELTAIGPAGAKGNRVSTGESLALFARDTIRTRRWTVTPGLRFESIDFASVNYGDPARTLVADRTVNSLDVLIPGVGVAYEVAPRASVFAGIHRGFAPPGPTAVDTGAEDSTNYEFGYRRNAADLTTELVGFFNDYSNLLGACTISSGCSQDDVGNVYDAGEVDVYGLEASLSYDMRRLLGVSLDVPVSVNYSYTHGEFKNSFSSDYEPWGEVRDGDELPYLPEHQLNVNAGLVHPRWSAYTNLIFVDRTRAVAGTGPIPDSVATDSHLLVDLSGNYNWNDRLRLFAQVRNLTDRIYVAARRPAGARPGIDRTLMIGLAYDF